MFDTDCSALSLGFSCTNKFYLTRQITSPSNATKLSSINFIAGDINISDNISYNGLLLNASFYYNGFLYAFAHTPTSNTLYQLRNNGTTASMTITGLPSSSWNNAVCTDDGILYLLQNGTHKLWKVNLQTLAVSSNTISGIADNASNAVWGDMIIEPTTEDLYCWYHPTASSTVRGLYRIDTSTNTFIFSGTNSSNTMGSLFYNSTGQLYGYGSSTIGGVQDRFYAINKATGATTQFGLPDLQVSQTDGCNCVSRNITLPVELYGFSGKIETNKTTHLTWNTASELNNDFFEIKRSYDAIEWETIGKVKGNGTTNVTSTYNFIDENPMFGTSYYLLKQVDFNKQFNNSPIVVVKMDTSLIQKNENVYVYPNPAKNEVFIKIENKTIDMNEAQVYNPFGHNIINVSLDSNLQSVNISKYPKGVYLFIIGNKLFKILKE